MNMPEKKASLAGRVGRAATPERPIRLVGVASERLAAKGNWPPDGSLTPPANEPHAATASAATAASATSSGASTWKLSPGAAFYLQASITVGFLASSSAPTPLYPTYQAAWGFSPIAVTVVFGIYALAVLGALLIAGRLSDHVGRRPVLIAATAVQAATMLLFATADGLQSLLIARVIQGLAVGAAVAAVGAGLMDLDRHRGTIANAVAPLLGTATGAIVAGLMVQYLPEPTHLVYLVLGGLFALQAIAVFFMPEVTPPRAGALASLAPKLSVPANLRAPLLLAVPALIATWALVGLYGSLAPTLARSILGFHSSLAGGLALFTLAASGGVAVLVMRHHEPRAMVLFGAPALMVGVGAAIAALSLHSATLFYLATVVAGAGFGAGFQGAVRSVIALAQPSERAGVLSIIFIVSYLAMGLPAVVAGTLIVEQGNVLATAQEFGTAVIVLGGLALLGATRKTKGRI
jgi:MFS family permease